MIFCYGIGSIPGLQTAAWCGHDQEKPFPESPQEGWAFKALATWIPCLAFCNTHRGLSRESFFKNSSYTSHVFTLFFFSVLFLISPSLASFYFIFLHSLEDSSIIFITIASSDVWKGKSSSPRDEKKFRS